MKYLFSLILIFIRMSVFSQEALSAYINEGLKSNLALLQKENNYQRSLEALKEAKGLFYPSVSFNARYTVSEGGRIIPFRVGDLLNNVYLTLNQLTSSNNFPVLENQEIPLLRPTEHETKLRLIQPLFNPDIYYNAKIKKEISISEQISLEQYRRELITEIKKAYYTVAMTDRVEEMLKSTRLILQENVRVNNRLLENNKITSDILLRSQTELYEFDQQLVEAGKNREIAGAYFNFLLNRPLNDSIIIEQPVLADFPEQSAAFYIDAALQNREELKNLEHFIRISDISVVMNQSGRLPDIVLVADYGFQGEKYEFTKDQDYFQASAVLSWDLFSGLQNRSKIRQSLIQKEVVGNQLEEAKNRISLQVISVLEELKAEKTGLSAADVRLKTARESFRLVNRRYQEGQSSLIEFMDARNSLTRAEENLIITQYAFLSKYAEFENTIVATNL